ncbi:Rv3235 family protein [Streptomyces sp. NBC_00648]|uniref:Rv3235 family protein n=1 Tax=Streptomyces sp. NBC_00648 TaxID=2975797 RepID=UPI0032490A99
MNRTDRARTDTRTDRTRPAGRGDRVGPGSDRVGPGPGRPGATAALARRRRLPRYWFAERLLAVLSGHRPVHWMLGHTVGEAYEQLVLLAPASPLRASGRPVVRHCDEYVPQPGVIEAFARIGAGDHVRAMAFRLEQGADLRWRCAAVEVGPGTRTVPGPTR